jgi:ketosteroid isomerase-like protein
MNIDSEKAAIQAVLDAVKQGLNERNPTAVVAQFTPDAVLFDLAPPLSHGVDKKGLAAWFDTWQGPVDQHAPDLKIVVSGVLAICHGLTRMSATTKAGGEQAQWWQRSTICLSKINGTWKIIHEHTSVPFHMDGSFRAAIDLQP